ncbi:MAG: zinc finger domain-containing protein, partial [Phascolarctobacterium sp.]
EITKVLELARQAKKIGHSLDAKVELHAEGEALDILKSVEKDLATLLIVSQATLVEGVAGGTDATGREDLKVTVLSAEGHKCERCWIYSDEVGTDAEHPTLCKRCADAVR